MRVEYCQHASAVRAAYKSARWDDETRRHFLSCPYCQEEMQALSWLHQLAQDMPTEAPPITSHLIWLKAQLAAREAARKKAWRPLIYIRMATEMLIGISMLFMITWKWPEIGGWFECLSSGSLVWSFEIFNSGAAPVGIFFFLMVVLSLGILATFNIFVHEE